MPQKKSTTKAKKFAIAGKDEIKPGDAVVGGEFQVADAKQDELAQGQTVTVEADTKFSDDHGTGDPIMVRTFEFAVNHEVFNQYKLYNGNYPTAQEVFDSHKNGIAAQLWGDGLRPADEMEPQIIFSKERDKYLIVVGAKPMQGMTLAVKTQTLSEIFNGKSTQSPKDAI